MYKFKDYLLKREGMMMADDKAEDGKSRPKKPLIKGPSSVTVSGVSGGAGGTGTAGVAAAPAIPTK